MEACPVAEKYSRMRAAESDREHLVDGTMTSRQAAAAWRRSAGLDHIHQIMAEPLDPHTQQVGIAAAKAALEMGRRAATE